MNRWYSENRTAIINIRINPDLKKDFKKMCEKKNISMGGQIETLMMKWMKGEQKDLFKEI